MSRVNKSTERKLIDNIPAVNWLGQCNRAWLAGDLIAELSVWALPVPQGIANSSIVGVPALPIRAVCGAGDTDIKQNNQGYHLIVD